MVFRKREILHYLISFIKSYQNQSTKKQFHINHASQLKNIITDRLNIGKLR